MPDVTIIEICGHRYRCRIHNGRRQARYNGEWIEATKFVDKLAEDGHLDQVAELVKLGMNVHAARK
jgi:hypothetical protein